MAQAPRGCFPCARQVARVERIRQKGDETQREVVYLLTSRSAKEASPEKLLELNRGHWGIENCLHYVRDVSFNEDRRYHRKNPHIFASWRNFALNIFRLLGDAYAPTWQRYFSMNVDAALAVLGVA